MGKLTGRGHAFLPIDVNHTFCPGPTPSAREASGCIWPAFTWPTASVWARQHAGTVAGT